MIRPLTWTYVHPLACVTVPLHPLLTVAYRSFWCASGAHLVRPERRWDLGATLCKLRVSCKGTLLWISRSQH